MVGCKKSPNYSEVPSITFQNLRVVHDFSDYTDSVAIIIGFQDGDGNLGNTPVDPSFYDYFVEIYKKTNGVYSRYNYFDTISFTYNGYLPLLSPYNVTGPIDGTITYNIGPFPARLLAPGVPDFSPPDPSDPRPFYKDDTIKFMVQIRDRANNYSNWVETSEYVVWGEF